jgi:thiol:disulfide interchange protein
MSEAVARLTGMIGGIMDGLKIGYHTFRLDEVTGKTEAYKTAIAKGKPLMVMVTASWCQPCQQFKREVLEPMDAANEFYGFVFTKLDIDQERPIANAIFKTTGKTGVPQLVVYYNDGESKCSQIFGKQPVEKVRELLTQVRRALIR